MSSSPVEYSIAPPARDPYQNRRPPYSEDAEQAVIAAMLMDADAIMRAAEHVDDTMFYREGHRRIFRAMVALTEKGSVVDPLTLSDELARRGELEASGGKEYIGFLVDAVPTAANVEYHAKIVREKALLRRLIEVSTSIVTEAFEGRTTAADLLDEAESKIFQVSQAQGTGGFTRIKELLWPAMERIEAVSREGRSVTGVPSGFRDLDELTSGFQPSDLVIVAARPSMGKCLAHDSEITLADGSVETIETLYHRGDARLLTLDARYRLGLTSPSAYVDDGHKPVFRVTTRLGRTVTTTLTHPFLTADGWKPLGEIGVGTHVAVPRVVPVFGNRALRDCEVKLLGYLLGDGDLTGTCPRFTNGDERLLDEFTSAVREFGGVDVSADRQPDRTPTLRVRRDRAAGARSRGELASAQRGAMTERGVTGRALAAAVGVSASSISAWTHGATAPAAATLDRVGELLDLDMFTGDVAATAALHGGAPNALVRWLETLELWGRDSHGKFIPRPVFTLPREQLALFLNRLFATDGWATVLASGQAQLGYCSVSERLARQVQHLLLRFGVVASLRERRVRYRDEERRAWQLDITDANAVRTFANEIGIFGKEDAVRRAVAAVDGRRYQTNRDLVPRQIWDRVAASKGAESWSSLARRAGRVSLHPRRRSPTRATVAALASALGDAALNSVAESDVYWDEVVSIEPVGVAQVYDLTIPETHNFVANDVCVHNTAFTLNIAQHAAIEHNVAVAFFSLEMSKDSLVQRMLTSEARIDAQTLRKGKLRDDDFPRLARAAGILSHAPVFIDDTPGITLLEMRSKARRLKAENGVGLVIVDYLQLMSGPANSENRQQEVSQISRGLKALAKELSVPVIALSQLSRAVEQRAGSEKGRPVLSDLRESGAIEQDADLIMFLFREEVYAERENGMLKDPGVEGKAEVIIGKQRNGPIGVVPLYFHKQYTRFEDSSRRQYEG